MNIASTKRPLIFGEVLFDHFPDGSRVLGGAPFNVAWHLQAFGLEPLFISRVGTDAEGDEIRNAMQVWGMDTTGLQIDPDHATGRVEVSFADGEPHYEIVKPCAWDFIAAEELPDISGVGLLYHGSLALRHGVSAAALAALQQRSAAPLFVDINLRPPWWDAKSARAMLRRARWLKLNEHELAQIEGNTRAETLLDGNTALIALTRGEEGATLIASGEHHTIHPQSDLPFIDAVGAGDAFCSVLLTGVLRNWPLSVTLTRAQEFASAVVGIRGATSRDRSFYQLFTGQWTH